MHLPVAVKPDVGACPHEKGSICRAQTAAYDEIRRDTAQIVCNSGDDVYLLIQLLH